MDAIPLEELKTEVCPRISAEDLLTLSGLLGATNGRNTSERSRASKPRIIVIDVRSYDEYPSKRCWVAVVVSTSSTAIAGRVIVRLCFCQTMELPCKCLNSLKNIPISLHQVLH